MQEQAASLVKLERELESQKTNNSMSKSDVTESDITSLKTENDKLFNRL